MKPKEIIKKWRKEKGWSQRDLAEESGSDKSTVNSIERGGREPRHDTVVKLAPALGHSIEEYYSLLLGRPVTPSNRSERNYSCCEAHADTCAKLEYVLHKCELATEPDKRNSGEWITGNIKTFHSNLKIHLEGKEAAAASLPKGNDFSAPFAHTRVKVLRPQEVEGNANQVTLGNDTNNVTGGTPHCTVAKKHPSVRNKKV